MPRLSVPTSEGKRVPLMARTTRAMRYRLEASAAESGRSLAQEVEFLLGEALSRSAIETALARIVRREVRDCFAERGGPTFNTPEGLASYLDKAVEALSSPNEAAWRARGNIDGGLGT